MTTEKHKLNMMSCLMGFNFIVSLNIFGDNEEQIIIFYILKKSVLSLKISS